MSGLRIPSRDGFESLLVRGLSALPPRAQQVLGGPRPIRIDGQQLEPEVQLTLRLLKLSGRSAFEDLPVAEARAEIRREAALYSGATIPIGQVDEVEVPGPGGAMAARLYSRAGLPSPAPLLVYLHGGGWVVGDLDTHDQPCRFLAQHAGVRVLSVDYRLAPEHPFPAAVEDAVAAVRHAIAEAPTLRRRPRTCRGRRGQRGRQPGRRRVARARDRGRPLPRVPAPHLSRHRPDAKARVLPAVQRGFFLTERQMDWYRDHYLPDEAAASDPRGVADARVQPVTGCRPRTSSPPGSTCCATKARTMRGF